MPTKPDAGAAAAMNTFVREALQRRRGAPPVDQAAPEPPAETAPPVPSIDAGARPSAAPEPDMNTLIRQRLGRA